MTFHLVIKQLMCSGPGRLHFGILIHHPSEYKVSLFLLLVSMISNHNLVLSYADKRYHSTNICMYQDVNISIFVLVLYFIICGFVVSGC